MSTTVLTSFLASTARLGQGVMTRPAVRRPEQRLRLYEFEACPFCRKVRDALTHLDLEALVLPCPKGGEVYRPEVVERGGKALFPYLEDPNTGASMYESDAIIGYLYRTYARAKPPLLFRASPLNTLSSMLASAARPMAGGRHREANRPEQPLELWSFEASPYSRLVRERLCELELPYVLHNVGRASLAEHLPIGARTLLRYEPRPSTEARRELARRAGRLQVPYLEDPNTGAALLESDAIRRYLDQTYAL